ncbi:MAG: cysteine desulfurase-like protein [Fuerstiella sp.]
MTEASWNVNSIRRQFPGLQRVQAGQPVAFFDGPAGSQVPQSVAAAVSHYLLHTNANCGAAHATSRESDELLQRAHAAMADFLGTSDPQTVCFGANMTTITLAVSRALSRLWGPGDEIIVSQLDHDANVTPWVLAARDAGATVHHIGLRPEDWTLDLDQFRSLLSEKTKLVAVGYASNATGTVNPVAEITAAAHGVGALTYIDAVHFAPHGRINVSQLDCDFLVCSAYKFFGPHVGILYGRRVLLEQIRPYKLRPSTDALPGKWMTGTQNHEGIAGAAAAVEYLASLDDDSAGTDDCSESKDSLRSAKLDRAFRRIKDYEQTLSRQFLRGVSRLSGVRVHGITDESQLDERVPTFSLTFDHISPSVMAERLAEQGIYTWAGNHYALPFTEAAGLEPDGTLRIGGLHYNNGSEVDRVLACMEQLLPQSSRR